MTSTPRLGADCSIYANLGQLHALNCTFVVRYVSNFPSKNLTHNEATYLTGGGMDMVLVFEDDINTWQGGYNAGAANAKVALAEARACEMPSGRPMYFAIDMDASPNDPRLIDYFKGINSVIGSASTGVYASTGVCRKLKSLGYVNYTWRTMSIGWNGGAGSTNEFNLEQVNRFNENYDRDVAYTDDFGQWRIGWTPWMQVSTVSLRIVDMCAKQDPARPQGVTTNFANVYPVEKALAAESLLALKYVDGSFGSMTVEAYKLWQQRLGYSGADADGIPGAVSLSKLGAKHSFKVVA